MRKLPLSKPPELERIIGFTIPRAGAFYVCDHDEVWRVTLLDHPVFESTDYAPYNFVEERTDFLGLVFEGLNACPPLLRVGDRAITYNVDLTQRLVRIEYRLAGTSNLIEFPILSGDWFGASLSEDGRFSVVAEPYELALYAVD